MKKYHQQRLDDASVNLTTFICPANLGRWQYVRAPIGLSIISEVYDRQMTEHLQGLPSHRKVVDNNLIFSKDAATHAQQVRTFLQRCSEKGIRLSEEMFHYMQTSIEFDGFQVVAAIRDFL